MTRAYYNEIDPAAAEWLRELIAMGMIAPGDVDQRSICDVHGSDLDGYTQVHLFAGIGVWSYALRMCGWPDDRPVWTGSCPCQPFSSAGKRKGQADERHLWPEMFRLIQERRPPVIFGEQVASADVIGTNVANGKDLQRVLDEQAIVRVLLEQGGGVPERLQAMRQYEAKLIQEEELQHATETRPGEDTGRGCAIPRHEDGASIRFASRGHTATDRPGGMRSDGDSVQSDFTEGVGYPITGPNIAGTGIHTRKRASGLVLGECDGTHLGAEQDIGDCEGHLEQTPGCLEQLVSRHRREIDEDASKWLVGIRTDLDSAGYAFGASVLTAAGLGAPHIRQRLYWLADSNSQRCHREPVHLCEGRSCQADAKAARSGAGNPPADDSGLGNAAIIGQYRGRENSGEQQTVVPWSGHQVFDGLDNPKQPRLEGLAGHGDGSSEPGRLYAGADRHAGQAGSSGYWSRFDLVLCRDTDKQGRNRVRRISPEPGAFPLVAGAARRVVRGGDQGLSPHEAVQAGSAEARAMRLRGYGNAINADTAAAFIRAAMVITPAEAGKEGGV